MTNFHTIFQEWIYRRISIKPKTKKKIRFILKISIALALLYYLIYYVRFEEIFIAIENSNKYYILSALILMSLNIYMQFLKWRIVCNSLLNIHDDNKIWKSLFYGFSAGILTPVRVGEYLGRKLAFKDVGILKVTISTIIEKFASLFIVLLVGSIATAFFLYKYFSLFYALPFIIIFLVVLTFSHFLFRGHTFSSNLFNNLAEKFNFIKKIKIELNYLKEINRSSVRLLMSYSLIFYFVVIIQYAFLAKAFDENGNILMFLMAGIIVMFVKSILSFVSFADLGIRESTSVFLVDKMGYSRAVGFNSAIFLFFINLVIPSIIGMFLLFQKDND